MANPIKTKEVAFNGRLRTYEDPASIGPNDFCSLENLRYTPTHPKSIYGMTAITDTGVASNINNLVHFRKGQPSESHVLVHAGTSVYDMTASIPSTGTFGSSIWTDTASGGSPRFAYTNGLLAYANGVGDTCVYGGDEFRTGGFIVYTSAAKYDYTEAVNNTKTDTGNVAILKTYSTDADTYTSLLLHCDGTDTGTTFTDSSPLASRKTVSAYLGAVTSTTKAKFGTASAKFPGTGYLTTPDHDDFDFSGGNWTVDCWISHYRSLPLSGTLYSQCTDANNYTRIYSDGNYIYLSIYSSGVEVVNLTSRKFVSSSSTTLGFWHLAVTSYKSGSTYYYQMFLNGVLESSTTSSSAPANYNQQVSIGAFYNGSTFSDYIGTDGYRYYVDEIRVSKSCRWTTGFTPPTSAYSANFVSNVYLGSIMPLSGAKLYFVDSKSGKTVSISVDEWNGESWAILSSSYPTSQTLADSTAYSLTWNSTASTSKMREVEKVVQYWYKLTLSSSVDFDGVTISRCTTKVPFQQIRDFWSGEPWSLAAFLVNKSGNFNDYTANVSDDSYDDQNAGSYGLLDSLTTSDYMVIGSTERLMGMVLQFAGSNINTSSTTINVSYYNGTDAPDQTGAWTSVNGLVDGTLNGTKTLNKSGFITWTPPTEGSEFKSAGWSSKISSTISQQFGSANIAGLNAAGSVFSNLIKNIPTESQQANIYPVYYYKITFSGATLTDVRVQYAYGIPAQRTLRGFKFPVVHQDRLWLCGDVNKDKNYVICSAYQSTTVLGFGSDNAEFWLGDDTEVVAGCSLFTRYGSTVADVLVICKQHETYVIDGNSPEDYKSRRVSEHIGCIAPLTMTTVPMGDEAVPGTPRNIAIWLSQQGVVAFDGNNFAILSKDIHDRFEPTNANYISSIGSCTAYYDSTYGEYHLIVPGSAEYVYDIAMKKWYTVNRGSYDLRCGTTVHDTNGLAYTFGAAATKLYRLEYGSTMAGDSFTRTLRTGEMALPEGSIQDYSRVNWYALVGKTMTNSVTGSYFTDTSTTAGVTAAMVTTNSGKRLFNKVAHSKDTQATFHGFQFEVADQFEPMYLAFRYTIYPRELS